MKGEVTKPALAFHPLTPARWSDFEELFGRTGACGGCWCMWWRVARSQFERQKGAGNRKAMKELVSSGVVPGVLAYAGGKAVGWCSLAPREEFPSIERSRVLKRLDDLPVWSLVCLYLARAQRGHGLTEALVRGAVDYAASRGAQVIEAYPTRPRGRRLSPFSTFMGLPSVFEAAGFVECARPSEAKVVMRCHVEAPRRGVRRRRAKREKRA